MNKLVFVGQRVKELKSKAAENYEISPENCHLGHIILQGLLENHEHIHQIDVATDRKETNISVATRSSRLADALVNYGLRPGDRVVVIGTNHVDITIPFYASLYNGYAMCPIDPSVEINDLEIVLSIVKPRMVFCPKLHKPHVVAAADKFNFNSHVITLDGEDNMEDFIKTHKGSEHGYMPAIVDPNLTAWLVLTSGTTGLPKVAVISYKTLLSSISLWWDKFTEPVERLLAMATIQWMSSLIFFVSTPIMKYTRLQASVPLNPQLLVMAINKYKPNATAWIPHMLGRFLSSAGDVCNLSCFKTIILGGSGVDKELYDKFQEKCKSTFLYLAYGMTELLVPVFRYNSKTPFGSTGQPMAEFQYKLITDEGNPAHKPFITGELYIKGKDFFKGYLDNPEETKAVLTGDGWVKTGDMFYKDEADNYYFVERKRLLIRHQCIWISPLQLEQIINSHPDVLESCVIGIPDAQNMELPIGAVVPQPGKTINPQDIFDLLKEKLPENKQLFGGLFIMDSLPTTPTGKIHRARVRDISLKTQTIMPK